ncbi:MAG: ASKHA domain-containing protein [Phycisphaerae bacterium]
MSDKQCRVTFEPQGRTVFVLPGTTIVEAAGRVGLTIQSPCGGKGVCGKCRVQVSSGACEGSEACRRFFSAEELAAGWRLACQGRICDDAVISIPQSSRLGDVHKILAEAQDKAIADVQPAVRKVCFKLPAPTMDDHRSDLMRLQEVVGPAKVNLRVLRKLGGVLRSNAFTGTAVFTDHHLVDVEPGDTTGQSYGVAFDIGTTTVVGSLLDLNSGEELALASDINPQVTFGDDVLSRIQHGGTSAKGLGEIHDIIIAKVNDLLAQLCRDAGVSAQNVYEVTFAGNTTMEHLLCGIDPTPLGAVPFVPVHGRGLTLGASALGLHVHPNAAAYVFPIIGGFVGGDTVAGLVATELADQHGPVMMVDIGTNGEIVLAVDGKLWAASTAAGPAFEGARISCGMRASGGAIEKIVFDGDVHVSVIGNVEPIGICGSALVDVAADLLRSGIITPEGRMLCGDELPAGLPPAIAARVQTGENGQARFLLAANGNGGVNITQRDIRELQLATGAIRAGITILLQQAGLTARDLRQVLMAGGFGSFIRRSNAQRIGLLPTEIHREKILYVGNASLNGAKWALVSTAARNRAEDLARRAKHVQLSEDMNFQMLFAECMIFPEN